MLQWQFDAALALASFPVVVLRSYWVLRELNQRRNSFAWALAMSVLMTAVIVALSVNSGDTAGQRVASAIIAMICGGPFVFAFVVLTVTLVSGAARPIRHPRALGLAAIAVPVLASPQIYAPEWTQVWSLVTSLSHMAIFLLLVMLLAWLRDAALDNGPTEKVAAVRAVGLMLALFFLYSSGDWRFSLIQMVAGYLVVRYLLLRPTPSLPAFVVDDAARARVIAGIIRLNDLERVTKSLKRDLQGKHAKGDVTYLSYQSKLARIELERAEAEEDLKRIDPQARELVLAFAPHRSAWNSGVFMGGYAVLIALPWIVLSLRDLRHDWYGLAPLINSGLNIVIRWILYGFLLGYFYPDIKGRTGIEKAFWFWLAMVAPAAIATAIISSSGSQAWLGLAFWILQLLITLMLLGLLAGDLQSLHRSGYRWRELLEVHNLGSLSAWASTLLIALGTTATTILASGMGNLVTAALQYAGGLLGGATPPLAPRP